MLLIVGSHFASHGVKQILWPWVPDYGLWQESSVFEKVFLAFLSSGGTTGVGLFFMLSGFFMIKKETRAFKLIKLVFQLIFYAFITTVLYFTIMKIGLYSFPELQSPIAKYPIVLTQLVGCIIPVTSGRWWFASAYFWIYLLSPVLNRIVLRLSKVGRLLLLVLVFVFWYVPSSMGFLTSFIQRGIFFYLLGAFCRLHGFYLKRWMALLASIAFYTLCAICSFLNGQNSGIMHLLFSLCNWMLCPFAVYSIFCFFSSFNFQNVWVNKVATTTFGIYLLHDSSVGRVFIWNVLVRPLRYLGMKSFVLFAFVIVLAVFCVCSVVDFFRIYLVEKPILPRLRVIYEKYRLWFSI